LVQLKNAKADQTICANRGGALKIFGVNYALGSALLLFCGCHAVDSSTVHNNSGDPSPIVNARASTFQVEQENDLERLARLWEKRTQDNSITDYPIGPGDVLEISVPAMEEIKERNLRVPADGTILLPFIGRIQAAGLTEAELAEQLHTRLKTYLRNPRVFIFVKEYNSRQVAVLGAVAKPGLYNLTSGSENILEMISRAGGVLADADRRIHFIPTEPLAGKEINEVRYALPVGAVPENPSYPFLKKTEPILIDVKELSYGGHQMYLSLPVRPGDTIMVPGGAQILVEGWVDKPGALKMTPGLTVAGAVAAAGGALFAADTSTVRVIRSNRGGKTISLAADLEKIKNGEMHDIGLQGGDIVQVSSSTAKLVPYGIYELFRNTIRLGAGVYR
jgi:polysaccharide export outer membrane protein